MTLLVGCDFSSTPTRRKPIVLALGTAEGGRVQLARLERIETLAGFAEWLRAPQAWIGGFDFPFGLPRELVESLGWPQAWPALIQRLHSQTRAQLVAQFKAFCAPRPAGSKFAHRRCDLIARSSPSMKWVNPPVAYMLLEGAPRLLAAGVSLPGLSTGDPQRVALEGYPALLARSVVGNASYKSDEKAKQTTEREARRRRSINNERRPAVAVEAQKSGTATSAA